MAGDSAGSSHWNAISVSEQAQAHIGHTYITNLQVTHKTARAVLKACRESSQVFASFVEEVQSFRVLLEATEDAVEGQQLSPKHVAQFTTVIDGCNNCLTDLGGFVARYNKLPTSAQRSWDRMSSVSDESEALKGRLGRCISSLSTLNGIFATRLIAQQGVNRLIEEVRTGKREGSIISTHSITSLDDSSSWKILSKELQDVGVTPAVFELHKDFISSLLQDAIESGKLEEQPPATISKAPDEQLLAKSQPRQSTTSLEAQKISSNNPRQGVKPEGLALRSVTKPTQPSESSIQKSSNAFKAITRLFGPKGKDLRKAIDENNIAAIQALLEGSIDQQWEKSTLDRAASLGNEEVFRLLFEYALETQKHVDQSILATAVAFDPKRVGSVEIVRIILEKRRDWVNLTFTNNIPKVHWKEFGDWKMTSVSTNHMGALEISSWMGLEEIAQVLLEFGADVNANSGSLHKTPLHIASLRGHYTIAKLLIDSGARPSARTFEKKTPLFEASLGGHVEVVRLLLEAGADPDAQTKEGATSIIAASWCCEHRGCGHAEVVRLLLEEGADTEVKCPEGTALFVAVSRLKVEITQLLIQAGADKTVAQRLVRNGASLHSMRGESLSRKELAIEQMLE